jgi:hypothetical protein
METQRETPAGGGLPATQPKGEGVKRLKLTWRRWMAMVAWHSGPVMWRCTNGAPNHRREFFARVDLRRDLPPYIQIPVTPAIVFTPPHESCLGRVEEVGRSVRSFTVALEWLDVRLSLMLGVTRNDLTIDQIIARRLRDPVAGIV